MNAPEVEHPERAEYRFARKAGGAVRGHLVTSNQEATDPLVDVVVDRAIRRQAGAVAEVRRPPPQQAVETIAHLGPATHIAGYEHSADLRLEPQHALLRRTRTQIPVAVLPVMVRTERVAEKVEALAPGVPDRGLRLVEGEPEPRHHRLRPRQSLGRAASAQDREVVGVGDHMGTIGLAAAGVPPVLQEAVHVQVGEQRADDPALRRGDYRKFRVRAMTMGTEETSHGTTQTA